jgi:hypothetical protein
VYQFPPLQAEILPASQQEKYQCPILQAEVVLPASQQEVYQFPILQTEVLPASQQEEYQCPILQEELVLSTSQQEEHQLPTLQAKLVLSTSHRQFAPPTLATANEAAEADKPSHILVSCLAQASPTAQKRDNLSTSRHYYGHGPSHQKLDKTGGLPAPVQSAGTKGVNGHQNWKDDRFKGSILAQADTATQVWATGDIVADTDSPARRAAQENADSTQVRGLQELGCIDKSRHADLDADRGVSDPIAKQPDLDTDLQVLVGLDRGLEAGHRTLGHTDSFHRSSDPDKRNKVNKSKEYLSSLMMDHLPPCFSGSQPEWNQCWYDTSTRVDSEGSTVRVSMECIRSPTCINLHPAEKVGSTVVTERPRMVRVICRKAKKYNYAHLNPDAQLLQIRELSRQPYQEADCILLTTRQQADVLLTTKQADVLLTTLQADVLLTTLQADVLLTTQQADVLLTTPQTNVLLTTQQADVQLADCVLLSIQKPVVHRDSVLNHADDQVVLLSSQQEDISNGSLIHIVTCIGAAVTEAKIQVAPECCAGGVIISMQHPDLQSHSKSPAKATAAEDACKPQSNKWRKFIITESEAEQVMGPATKIKSNNTMISDEKSNSVPTFSAAHNEDEVAVKHEEAVNSSLSSSTVETAGMVTSAASTSGEAASNSLGKRKFKTSILGGIEIHQVERVPEMETVIDKVGVEIIISDAVPDIDLTSRAGSSISPRTLSSEKQASDQESKDEAAPKKTKTQSTDQNNCNTYPNVEVCKLVSATQQAECGQLSIQQCLEESSILGAECSLLSIQQVNTNCQDIGPTRSVKITLEQHFCCTHFQAALSSVQHQNYQWAAMIGARSIAVCAMISILKQHEEAQAAAELQAADTMLPATVQVKVYTSKANDAAANLPTGKVTSGDAVTADAVIDADRATRTQAAPQAEAQAAAGPRATGSIQPATVQVQVCSVELKDAASNLPVGHVDSGGITDTASRPHDAPAEGGQQRKEAQPGAGLQAADTMQPATVQVKVCKVKTNCTAANLPLGNVASGGVTVDADTATGPQDAPQVEAQAAAGLRAADSMQPATELKDAVSNLPVANVASGGIEVDTDIKPQAAPSESERLCAEAHAAAADTMQPVVQVQVCTAELNDTASNLLPGSIITRSQPSQLLDSSSMQATQASQILDRCMARASAAAKKLDRLSASQAIDGKPALAGIHPTNLTLQSPGAQLDSVLARAASLLGKLDNLSSRVSGTRELDRIQGQVAYHLSSSSMSPTVGLVTSSEHPVETVGSTDRQIALPVVEDHKGEQDYLRHMPEKGAHTTNKEATFQPMEEPMQFTTVSMVSEATCQKAERLTTVSMLSEVTGRKAEQLRTVSMVSEVTGQKAEQLITIPKVSEVTSLQFTTKPIAREVVWATCQHAEQQGQLTTMKDRGLIQVSYQDRSTQTINCRVSDPVAIQLDLGCDLQERDSADRDKHAGLQTGHQVLDHTSHYHSSNVPDKRNKVNEQREYLTSLMLEQVPLCSSGRQPEQKKHWDDTSTIVISVGSTATTSTGSQAAGFKQSERLKVQICTMDTNDASPHSPVNAGSRQLAGSIDREACTQSTGQNMQSTYIRNEVSKHNFAEQPADCVLLPIQRADCHRLPINQTDCNLQHIEEADCVRQHIQETNSVLLSNQHTACVLLIIQQLVTHHSSVLNSNDDLVVLHFSQQEARQTDGSNGSLAQLFTGLPHHHLHPQVIEEVSEDSTVLPSVHGGVLALALEECSRDTEGLQKAETSFSPAKLLSQQMPAKPIQVQVSKTGRNDTAIILPIGHGKLKEKHTVGVTHSPRHKYLHQSHVQQIGALPESAELDEAVHTFQISRVAWQLMQTSGSVAAGIRKQSLPAGSQDKEPFIIQGWCDISNKADSVGSTVESSADRVSSACISSLIMNGGNRAAHHPSQEHYPLRVSQVLEQENRDEKLLTSKEEVDLTNMGSIEGLIDQEEGQDVHQQQQGSPVWPDEVEHEVNTCPVVCSEHQSDEKTERESLDQDDRAKPCKGRMSVVTSTADQADDPNGSEAVEPDMRSATRRIIPNLEASSRETVPALSVCTVRRPGSAVDLKDEICAQDKGVQAQPLEVERLESIPANPAVVHGDVQVDVVHDGHGGTGRSVEQCTQHVRPHHPCQEAIQGDSEPAVHDGTIGSMEVVDGWVQAEVGHESHPPHPQFELHMLAQMAMTCIISLHYCRKVTTLSSSNVAVTELITSPASGKVNLLSSFMNEAINGSSMSQGVATSRLCDTVHGQGHHHQHDQGHQLLPDDEAGPVQQVYPSTISIGWAEKGCTSANSMDCSSLLYNKVEDYAVAHALLHIAREEVGSCQDILYRHVLEPQLLQGRIQASFLFILKQKLTRYFPETGPDHEDCHHARVPQPPALQGHHHHRCRDVQREQGQGPET